MKAIRVLQFSEQEKKSKHQTILFELFGVIVHFMLTPQASSCLFINTLPRSETTPSDTKQHWSTLAIN